MLALDTGVGVSACLLLANGAVASVSLATSRAHSKVLLPMLQGLLDKQGLAWQDIQSFAVGVGPGSFTALRVACATIAGINASLQKPVFRLASLEITANQTDTEEAFWVIEDARSGLVYVAEFAAGQCITEAQCLPWQDFLNLKPAAYLTLSDAPVDMQGAFALPVQYSREQALAKVAQAISISDPSALWVEPLYLQASQAEKNLA